MRVGLEGQPLCLKQIGKGYDYQCVLRSTSTQGSVASSPVQVQKTEGATAGKITARGEKVGAKPAQPSDVSPEAGAPAWQSAEIRVQYEESTVSVKFGEGWYETPIPVVVISQDKLTYRVPVEYHNLGPKTVWPFCNCELKVSTGYIYGENGVSGRPASPIDPGKSASGVLEFRIPPGMTPVELVGTIPVSLKVPAKPIAEATVKVPSVNPSNPFDPRCLKVLRCEMAGFGKNPTLTLEYENKSDEAQGVLLEILYQNNDGKTMGQEDLRGPIAPGEHERLVYGIAAAAPQGMVCCGVNLCGYNGRDGSPPVLWIMRGTDSNIFGHNNYAGRPIADWVTKESRNNNLSNYLFGRMV